MALLRGVSLLALFPACASPRRANSHLLAPSSSSILPHRLDFLGRVTLSLNPVSNKTHGCKQSHKVDQQIATVAPGRLLCATPTTPHGSSGGLLSPHSVQGPWLSWTPFRPFNTGASGSCLSAHPYQPSLSCTEPSKIFHIFLNPESFPTLHPSQEPVWCYYPNPYQTPSW